MVTEFPPVSTLMAIAWLVVIAAGASALIGAIAVQRQVERDSLVNRVVAVWLAIALCAVVVLTLQPGPQGFSGARPSVFDLLAPLATEDAIANTLLYIPVGLFAALLWRSKSSTILRATGFAFSVSFAIEFAQWLLPIDRAATTHDVIFNTLGGFVGAVLGTLIVRVAGSSGKSAPVESDRI